MKRDTETTKWEEQWFRKLSGNAKLLWYYLNDKADPAGVVELDYQLASEDCRLPITPEHLAELKTQVQVFAGSKVLIRWFIKFQYVKLSDACLPHKAVFQSIKKHGLIAEKDGSYSA